MRSLERAKDHYTFSFCKERNIIPGERLPLAFSLSSAHPPFSFQQTFSFSIKSAHDHQSQHQSHHQQPPSHARPAPSISHKNSAKELKNIRDPRLLQQAEVDKRLKSLRRRASWLDSKFSCCCGLFRFGMESVIGLIPVIGDFVGIFLALSFMNTIRRRFNVPASLLVEKYVTEQRAAAAADAHNLELGLGLDLGSGTAAHSGGFRARIGEFIPPVATAGINARRGGH
ncbi:hypothetical protein BX661DRAFT_180833 [Kickxella alabastrina]|uniref:uncharacterized protein n=1 Tax=Kickxella alabastrina TaxID=61397 RepID=UPI002220503F|nr:uncharacterized protein BX661DRAFT_180833 [Kickxella alabastrina]KAI7829977.1 hypothetical protein BX661DRAFT_180833 [Kickxella alabastrina]